MRKILTTAATAAVVLGTAGTALAVSGSSSPSAGGSISGCIDVAHNRTLIDVHRNDSNLKCPKGDVLLRWNTKGTRGPAGPPGPAASDVKGSLTTTWAPSLALPASIATGGPFFTNKTELGTITLKPGTYLLNVNFKARPPSSTTANVFPQLFVYNGVALADFSNDLFNVGSGALQNTASNTIDSYFSGSGVVTVKGSAETLHVYGFGYDSDKSAGSYTLETASITVVRVG
jgi:hypothetical protein